MWQAQLKLDCIPLAVLAVWISDKAASCSMGQLNTCLSLRATSHAVDGPQQQRVAGSVAPRAPLSLDVVAPDARSAVELPRNNNADNVSISYNGSVVVVRAAILLKSPSVSVAPLTTPTISAATSARSTRTHPSIHGSSPRKKKVLLYGYDRRAWRSAMNDVLRKPCTHHCANIVSRQRGNGAYLLRPLPLSAAVVDHVFELQAVAECLVRATGASASEELRAVLRQFDWGAGRNNKFALDDQPIVVFRALSHARNVSNDTRFLVATDGRTNVKKGGGFRRALNQLEAVGTLERGLEAELLVTFTNSQLRNPFPPEEADQAVRGIVSQLRDVEDGFVASLRDSPVASTPRWGEQYGLLADEVTTLFEDFGITKRV